MEHGDDNWTTSGPYSLDSPQHARIGGIHGGLGGAQTSGAIHVGDDVEVVAKVRAPRRARGSRLTGRGGYGPYVREWVA